MTTCKYFNLKSLSYLLMWILNQWFYISLVCLIHSKPICRFDLTLALKHIFLIPYCLNIFLSTSFLVHSKSGTLQLICNPFTQLPVLSWTNGCKAQKWQIWKLILIALYALGSTKENLYILWCKIILSERTVIEQNQIMLTLMVCLRLGAIMKQEHKSLCGPQWTDNTLKLISYKYIPLQDLWSQFNCSLKWNTECWMTKTISLLIGTSLKSFKKHFRFTLSNESHRVIIYILFYHFLYWTSKHAHLMELSFKGTKSVLLLIYTT